MGMNSPLILLIEPFYGGSHQILIDCLRKYLDKQGLYCRLITLPAKKWHWRARCGALQIFQNIPEIVSERFLFCSSVLNLSELLGIRPDLHTLKKIVYFHENQLIYPVQAIKDSDVQYGYNQITTCLSADVVLFNSAFNRDSFLDNIKKIIKFLPDYKPKNIKEQIETKSKVVYFPVSFPKNITIALSNLLLHIVWPHRWEFDKGPAEFSELMLKLKRNNHKFKLSVIGETFTDIPVIFDHLKQQLSNEIVHFGYIESKEEYFGILSKSHVVISTAKHDFFGVSVLEATYCGCLPLVPNALVYPEIYPKFCLYDDLNGLYKVLEDLCDNPQKSIELRKDINIDFNKFSKDHLLPIYMSLFNV